MRIVLEQVLCVLSDASRDTGALKRLHDLVIRLVRSPLRDEAIDRTIVFQIHIRMGFHDQRKLTAAHCFTGKMRRARKMAVDDVRLKRIQVLADVPRCEQVPTSANINVTHLDRGICTQLRLLDKIRIANRLHRVAAPRQREA